MQQETSLAREVNDLRDKVGSEVILTDSADVEESYRIVTELHLLEKSYVVLFPVADGDDDVYLFRYELQGDEFIIEPIQDEEEWEEVAEAYDEWLYFKQMENEEA